MSVETTRQVMLRYTTASHSDVSMLAPDVVFTVMGTGQQYKGPDAVIGMLDYFYHTAFDAHIEDESLIFDDGKAVLEAMFAGKHVGDFAGIPATNKDVRVPLCVVYDIEGSHITAGRVYFETDALRSQLGAN